MLQDLHLVEAAYVMASVVLSCPCFGHIQGYVVIDRGLMLTLLVFLQKKVMRRGTSDPEKA